MNKNKQAQTKPWWEDSALMEAAMANRSKGKPIVRYVHPTDLDPISPPELAVPTRQLLPEHAAVAKEVIDLTLKEAHNSTEPRQTSHAGGELVSAVQHAAQKH